MKTVLMFACIEVMTLIQDIILYQIILVTEHIRSREFQMDSMYWLFQDRKMVNTSRQHQERSQFPVEMQPWM